MEQLGAGRRLGDARRARRRVCSPRRQFLSSFGRSYRSTKSPCGSRVRATHSGSSYLNLSVRAAT
eukprot:scaffold64713_cov77-Phaeocystis_antarctica.AAC.2